MPPEPEPRLARGALLQPIQHRVLREEILDRLRASILTGDLEPGTRVIEADVAAEMGTSRVPVREAIRQLEQEGLVELHPHRGAVVASLSEAEIEAVYEIRAVIEAEAIKRACVLATKEDTARLERLCADMEHALRMHDLTQVAEIDLHFHEAMLAISDFGLVRRVWRSVDGLIRVRTFRLLRQPGPLSARYLRAIVDRHRSLVAAISAGDGEAAAAQARHHVLEVRDRMAGDGTSNEAAARA
jgi:DNA-binding GntR family transcriptional regulator